MTEIKPGGGFGPAGPREIGMALLDVEDELAAIRQRLTQGVDDPPWTPQYATNTIQLIIYAEQSLAEIKSELVVARDAALKKGRANA